MPDAIKRHKAKTIVEDEFATWLLGNGSRARIIMYLCTREEQAVNTPHLRRVAELSSGTQYQRVFEELERFGMVRRDHHRRWVVEPSARWGKVRELVE